MFPVTLNEIMAKGNFRCVLSLKAKLIRWKKRGVLFFQEPVGEMEMTQEFLLYWSEAKGKSNMPPNAFPVPKEDWKTLQLSEPNVLNRYFAYYYNLIQVPHSLLENSKVYIGEEFVWFYQERI